MEETRRDLINNVVTAVDNLVSASLAEKKRNDPDSMGTYYEEAALNKAITELVTHITGEVPSGESR